VTAFLEKADSTGPGWINNGCYILNPDVFGERVGAFSIERDIFPDLVATGELACFEAEGPFRDIGLPEDYQCFVEEIRGQETSNS
jgi:D-glycero-alpha-D-manno-heptose 1-phosphate guanylyltransferase